MKFIIFAIILMTFLAQNDARVIKRQVGFPFVFPQQPNDFGGFPNFQGNPFLQGQFVNQGQGQQFQPGPNQQQGQFQNQGQQFPNQQQGQFQNQGQQFPQQQGQQPQGQQQQQQFQEPSTTVPPQVARCVEDCITRTPGTYNPVCGSDNQNYHNQERFDCAVECGLNIRKLNNGSCPSRNATTNRPSKK